MAPANTVGGYNLSNGFKGFPADETTEDDKTKYFIPDDIVKDYGVDKRDTDTPDRWIKRHPELVRLTGRHPFNCEAPLSRLAEHGFITPASLHYVRNHGYVPKGDWDTWSVEVSGLLKHPTSLTMSDILSMPSRTIPVTLVCAGNRRKEENMIKQTIGFNWGAAGVSTSVWKGVRLCDVLQRCGILSAAEGANYVCFEGDETLPKGGGSKYGTSIRRRVALDPACDVMLAYEQNGQPLEPDHGYPLRMIIPGYIGGRMVKWLRKIIVSPAESDTHYHYFDNRVFPPHVDAEVAAAEGWWYNPDFIINELNINSAIFSPAHGETLPLAALSSSQKTYTIRGYAYSGGGRKVTRAEITLDEGKTWRQAALTHTEKPTEYDKYWCWCHWHLEVDSAELVTAKEIAVRAWDEGMNTQPQQITWNLMGMMNNCWFRVKISVERTGVDGTLSLLFEHPTRPGAETGGWMAKEQEAAAPVVAAAGDKVAVTALAEAEKVKAPSEKKKKVFTMAEVEQHGDEKSAWIVIRGKVYDATPYLEDHPGGADSILMNAGTDCTDEFEDIHSAKARKMLEEYYIGDLVSEEEAAVIQAKEETKCRTVAEAEATSSPVSVLGVATANGVHVYGTATETIVTKVVAAVAAAVAVGPPKTLHPKQPAALPLVEKTVLSHDTRLFRFALPSPQHCLGLPVGKHMFLAAKIGDRKVTRAYTPTSSDSLLGCVELVIKVYEQGIMTRHLDALELGGTIEVKGPLGHIEYKGHGNFLMNNKPRLAKRLSMVAGGTGITPMYQVAKHILGDPSDATEIRLVFANKSPADILLRQELDEMAAEHANFRVWYTVNDPGAGEWAFSKGRVSEGMFREHLFPPGDDSFAFFCGPAGFVDFGMKTLEEVGYKTTNLFKF